MVRTPCCDKSKVKKGAWSPEEDATLKNYLHKHGTHGGNWIALPHKAGLQRCGKSCRLRWLNYLRPDIKHGAFTPEEEHIICNLYDRIGSRWSAIASHLPGRTDNDVKNYWNTKLKKKFMAANSTMKTATSASNAAAAASTTAIFDKTTTFPTDSPTFPPTFRGPFQTDNNISTVPNANAISISYDGQMSFHSTRFTLEGSSNVLFPSSHQDSNRVRLPSFGMDEICGVKSSSLMDEYFSHVEAMGTDSNADLFSIFHC